MYYKTVNITATTYGELNRKYSTWLATSDVVEIVDTALSVSATWSPAILLVVTYKVRG